MVKTIAVNILSVFPFCINIWAQFEIVLSKSYRVIFNQNLSRRLFYVMNHLNFFNRNRSFLLKVLFLLLIIITFGCGNNKKNDQPKIDLGDYLLKSSISGKSVWKIANDNIKFDDFSDGTGWILDRTLSHELKIILPSDSRFIMDGATLYIEEQFSPDENDIYQLRLEKEKDNVYKSSEDFEWGKYELFTLNNKQIYFYGEKLRYKPQYMNPIPLSYLDEYLRIVFKNGFCLMYKYNSKDDRLCPFLYSHDSKKYYAKTLNEKHVQKESGDLKSEGTKETWLYKKITKITTEIILYIIIYIIVNIAIIIISGPEAVYTAPISLIVSFILFFVWLFFFT